MGVTKHKKTLVLLDVHAIIHRAYHALPDFSSSKGEPTGALYGLLTMLLGIIEKFSPDYIVACFDLPKPTYRHEAYDGYKAGRKKAEDDLIEQIKRSHDIFKALHIPEYSLEGFEADDMLGTIVELTKKEKDLNIVIASGDMDTLQLVSGERVRVFTLKKGIKDTIVYGEKEVEERFGFGPALLPDYKGLRGDPSDNIIGIAGIGEKTATTLITTFGGIEGIYKALKKDKKAFKDAGISDRIVDLLVNHEEDAEFSKMLATIRRDAPISFSFPKELWQKSVDIEKITKLLQTLEFRSIISRVQKLFAPEQKNVFDLDHKVEIEEKISFSVEDFKKASIALWLLNSSITNPTEEEIFARANTRDPKKALENLLDQLKKNELFQVYEKIEFPLIPIIEKMEKRGVKIDTEYLKKLSLDYTKKLKEIEKEIWKLAGEEFNVASPKQLGAILFEKLGLKNKRQKKTPGGAVSTKESELEKLKDSHPIISLVLSHRELSKLLGTYIDAIPKLVGDDGRLHATFIQTGAVTGRMASRNPGLQNIPIKTDIGYAIRHAFVAEKVNTLLVFDYSQIELRIAAFLSGDEKLLEIFRKGEDVHTSVASRVFGVNLDEVTSEMRRQAKVINFGILYGMGVNALKANLGTSREEAQKFYDDYFETFKTLAKYLENTRQEAAKTGYTKTFFGRKRYFEGIKSRIPFIRAAQERMAINAPIQGTEADIVKLAMIKVDDFLKENSLEDDVSLILQIHDELVYEAKEEKKDFLLKEIKKVMESVMSLDDTMGVPITAEGSFGKDWAEAK